MGIGYTANLNTYLASGTESIGPETNHAVVCAPATLEDALCLAFAVQ
jgi:hypothetical protein